MENGGSRCFISHDAPLHPSNPSALCVQRSISFRNVNQPEVSSPPPPPSSSTAKTRVTSATVSNPCSGMTATRVSAGAASTGKRRDSKLWSETFDVKLGATQPLSPKEIKRQEVSPASTGNKRTCGVRSLPEVVFFPPGHI